tara:strand:+ start:870 stop:1334 length:465 start_codon:yes stop_codon:yes gene_type:complete
MKDVLKTLKSLIELELGIEDLATKNRKRYNVRGRTIYFILGKKYTKESYETIGSLVGRDHSTALHGRKKIYNDWTFFPLEYKDELHSLNRIEQNFLLELKGMREDKNYKYEDSKVLDLLRRKNRLLEKEIDELKKDLKQRDTKIKSLEKYAPLD